LVLTHDSLGVMGQEELDLKRGFQLLSVHANFDPGSYTVRLAGADENTTGTEVTGDLRIVKP
jgi:hypothetical protein